MPPTPGSCTRGQVVLAYRKTYRVGVHIKDIADLLLCNVEESEFYPACLDCAKHPTKVYRCLENVRSKLGIECCGLCENWVDPKPTVEEKLMGVCSEGRHALGISCWREGCEDFEKRDPEDFDTERFDLSGLNDMPHYPRFDEDDEYEQGYPE